PWWPWHPLTRQACKPVTPGAIEEYQIEVMATANLFRKGHRICLDITSLDLPTGVAGATNAEYVPYHICSSKTVLHKVHHDRASVALFAAHNSSMPLANFLNMPALDRLPAIPVIDLRDGGPVRHAERNPAPARELRDACLAFFPRAALPLMPTLDLISR